MLQLPWDLQALVPAWHYRLRRRNVCSFQVSIKSSSVVSLYSPSRSTAMATDLVATVVRSLLMGSDANASLPEAVEPMDLPLEDVFLPDEDGTRDTFHFELAILFVVEALVEAWRCGRAETCHRPRWRASPQRIALVGATGLLFEAWTEDAYVWKLCEGLLNTLITDFELFGVCLVLICLFLLATPARGGWRRLLNWEITRRRCLAPSRTAQRLLRKSGPSPLGGGAILMSALLACKDALGRGLRRQALPAKRSPGGVRRRPPHDRPWDLEGLPWR